MGVPNDPLFSQQWHLLNTGQTGGLAGIDINVVPVWDDYTGEGVTVAVVDTGVDETHPDLVANYDARASYNYFMGQPGGASVGDPHGTACAGLIAAEANNGIGGTGVAPEVTFASFSTYTYRADWTQPDSDGVGRVSLPQLDIELFQGLQSFDISSHSYIFGLPIEDEFQLVAPLQACIDLGRGGLGHLSFWAGTNGRATGTDTANFPHLNVRGVMAVAAVGHNGIYADYSTPGAALFVCAPSKGSPSSPGITTTDIQGAAGADAGNYWSDFGGTSAATPIAAGVAALILDANASLGWRDAQDIFALTARQVDAGNASWVVNKGLGANGGGLHWSRDYGFGLIDAHAAVRLAETWTEPARTSANDASVTGTRAQAVTISQGTLTQTLTLSGALDLQHVQLYLDLDHQNGGDLIITLTSPAGTTVKLYDRPGVSEGNPLGGRAGTLTLDRPFLFNGFWGESAAGTWTLTITDVTAPNNGTLRSWRLEAWGDTPNADDRYVFTDEYARLASDDPQRRTLSDTGGIDTLNAAAVTGNLVLDLNAGTTSTIAGTALQIAAGTVIEHAYGGDGNDRITGNGAANVLDGGRGNDTLIGGGGGDLLRGDQGMDSLNGGDGADTLQGAAGKDSFDGGTGIDTIDYGFATLGGRITLGVGTGSATIDGVGESFLNIENAIGSQGNDSITGSTVGERLDGAGGNDSIAGGAGNDTLLGGSGNDTLLGDAGNDSLLGDDGDDLLRGGAGTDSFNGGTGNDTIDYSYSTIGGRMLLGTTTGSATLNGESEVFTSIENAIGSQAADTINGSAGANRLEGGGGNDSIVGGGGNDTIVGGTGSDSMDGGAGLDTVDYGFSASGGRITLGGATGTATIGGVAETFAGFENAGGSQGVDTIVGSGGANSLDGAGGNDSIAGGAGNDTLSGGAGRDTLDGGTGIDTIDYRFSALGGTITLGIGSGTAAIGGITETFLNIENATGSEGDDTLTGTTAGERLDGAGGNDSVVGGAGSDTLLGGNGDDTLSATGGDALDGGAGNDLLNLTDYLANTLSGGAGIDTLRMTTDTLYAFDPGNGIEIVDRLGGTIFGSAGNDTLDFSATTFVAVASVDGSLGNDRIVGTAGADRIDGGYGNDTVFGGAGPDQLGFSGGWGDDSLVGGDDADEMITNGRDTLDGGAAGDTFYMWDSLNGASVIGGDGIDLISYTYRSGSGTIYLAAGTATIGGIVDTFSSIESVVGSQGNNTVIGSSEDDWIWAADGNDSVSGAAGDDNINGGNGTDTLDGGSGDDTVRYDQSISAVGGSITLNGATGSAVIGGTTDTLRNFEHAVGSTGNDTITGYGAANRLDGKGGNDSLSGLADNDTLIGGAGNDTFLGGTGSDIMSGGDGADLFRFTATAFNTGDVAAGVVDNIWGGPGDRIDFAASLEALLKVDGVALSAATSNISLASSGPLAAGSTNLWWGLTGVLQFDLNNNGVYDPNVDFAINVWGTGNLTYVAAGDYFLLS